MLDNDKRDAARTWGDAYGVIKEGNVVRVRVTATLTDEVGREIRSALIQHLDDGTSRFIIDFTGLDMIVSSGLGFLVSMNALMSARSAKFVLINTNPNIAAVFNTTKMALIIPIVDSDDAAVKKLA